MKDKNKPTSFGSYKGISLIISVLILSLSISYFVFAWSEPTAVPPGDNVSPPLNISSVDQSKEGGLILNTGGASTNGLVVENGNVGIGAVPLNAKLEIDMQTPVAEGLHISRDGAAAFSYLNIVDDESGNTIFKVHENNNVGIGTILPGEKLEVDGNIKAGIVTIKGDGEISTELNADKLDGYHAADLLAAGGGGVTWEGYTTNPYYGDMEIVYDAMGGYGAWSGVLKMQQACNNEYPGSHPCTSDEIFRLGVDFPNSEDAWLIDGAHIYESGAYSAKLETSSGSHCILGAISSCTCTGWGSPFLNARGPSIESGRGFMFRSCNSPAKIPCCS